MLVFYLDYLQSLLDPKGAKWEKTAREITNMMMDTLLLKSEAQ